MKKHIALLAGDGIGPEVVTSAREVLVAVATRFQHQFEFTPGLVGGAAYDKYQEHLPAATIQICQNADAVLFGSVGGPINLQHTDKWNNCEAKSILALRKAFNFNINLRKITIHPALKQISPLKNELLQDGLDIIIFRELLGDVYFGEHLLSEKNKERYAYDSGSYTESQITSIARKAFAIAQTRQKKVISVDKANVLAMSKLWREVVTKVALDFDDIELQHMLVDNCAMQLIKQPASFDVILTSNLFGDILSDELSVLSGSIGMMPSASFNGDGFALYEPAGGSAPDIAGLNKANPIAQIMSASMLLEYSFALHEEAQVINQAIYQVISAGYRTCDLATKDDKLVLGTREFTQKIIQQINK